MWPPSRPLSMGGPRSMPARTPARGAPPPSLKRLLRCMAHVVEAPPPKVSTAATPVERVSEREEGKTQTAEGLNQARQRRAPQAPQHEPRAHRSRRNSTKRNGVVVERASRKSAEHRQRHRRGLTPTTTRKRAVVLGRLAGGTHEGGPQQDVHKGSTSGLNESEIEKKLPHIFPIPKQLQVQRVKCP